MSRLSIDGYFEAYPEQLDVFQWSHAKHRLKSDTTLCMVLQYLRSVNAPQILYANGSEVTRNPTFGELCSLLEDGNVWALNVGEAHFSGLQCDRLIESVRNSAVAFMFVEGNFVGNDVVRVLKDIIRDRRRHSTSARWLIGTHSSEQDAIIMRCCSMWWAPWSLGRNQSMLKRRR